MMNRKILFLLCLILFISISAVSAADDSNQTLNVFQSGGESIISDDVGTFSELQEQINNAENESAIELDRDYAYSVNDSLENGIIIDKSITINGNGHTIDGGIFYIGHGVNVILNNMVFMEGFGFSGGAIYASSDSLQINDCTFIDNEAVIGGAIFSESNSLQINGCTFINNTALESGGGAIYILNSETSITNSSFLNNSLSVDYGVGSAICFESYYEYDVVISNSVFNNNLAQEYFSLHSDGVAYLTSSDGFLDHQMAFIVPYDTGNPGSYPNINFTNVSYNEFKNQSFIFDENDLNYGIDNVTVLFEVYKDDELVINTTNVTRNGQARIDLSSLSVGYYLLRAYCGMTDSTIIQVKRDSNFTMSVDDIRLGEDLVIFFDISPEIEGYGEVMGACTIWDADFYGQKWYDVPDYYTDFNFKDKNITIQFPYVGNFIAVLDFEGDDTFYSERINQSFNVYPADHNMTGNKTIIMSEGLEKNFGESKRLYVALSDIDLNPLKNREIIIKINGVSYVRTTDDDGIASMAINLGSGEYDAIISFNGDGNYLPSANVSYVSVKPTIVSEDYMHKYCRDSQAFEAQFLDSNGNLLTDGEATFNINGVFYKRSINQEGVARLNINLDQGKYTITVTNPQTGEMRSSVIYISPTITDNHDLIKFYRNDSAYIIRLDGYYTPLVGEKVTFNINGVFYDRYSDENGYAKLNINLGPGEYIITAEYNGCRVSNNIMILPVLSANDLEMHYGDGSAFLAYLLDGEGYYYEGQEITFNINGVFYTRITDDCGIARLNINLMPGEYIITSSYNGVNVANKVTVSS